MRIDFRIAEEHEEISGAVNADSFARNDTLLTAKHNSLTNTDYLLCGIVLILPANPV
jgi:hypothetical protein